MQETGCEYKLTIEGAAPENLKTDSFNILFYNSNKNFFEQEDLEGEEENQSLTIE